MRIAAKLDYATRSLADLAAADQAGELCRIEDIAAHHDIPLPFLRSIFTELKRRGLVRIQHTPVHGHALACDPSTLTIGDIARAIGTIPETPVVNAGDTRYPDGFETIGSTWAAACDAFMAELDRHPLTALIRTEADRSTSPVPYREP